MKREQVKDRLRREGVCVKHWARDQGFDYLAVIRVLNGFTKGHRGEAHRIAVALGIK
jgi:gp16 family phage-associated protein